MSVDDKPKTLEEWLHDDFDGAELNNILGTALDDQVANDLAILYRQYTQGKADRYDSYREAGELLFKELDRLIEEWREV
jgi:hypothetical protein